jgi:hypothetical protein
MALKQVAEPTFNQPPLYKHYFLTFKAQVDQLRDLSQAERYKMLVAWIKEAIRLDQEIEDLPLAFERHGKGDHLQAWLTAANAYYRKFLKT